MIHLPGCAIHIYPDLLGGVTLKAFFDQLRTHLADDPPSLDGSQSVLAFLYEAYNQANPMDDTQIKADFDALYQAMNGMELHEMDRILCPLPGS